METNQSNRKAELIVTREFNAPKETVFDAFADAEALAQWWGPPGVPVTVIRFEFVPKGVFHYKAEMNGQIMCGIFVYQKIRRPDLLEFVSSSADEQGKIVSFPFVKNFPLEIFNRLEFSEANGRTRVTLTGYPVNATEDEMKAFAEMASGMQQGFAGTFNQLETYLSKHV